jgi:hypothetical protein
MEWWTRLDPTARRAVMIGVPLVAIAALVSTLRDRGAPTPAAVDAEAPVPGTPAASPPPVGGWVLGAADAVNVGELGSMFSDVAELLTGLPQAISDQIDADRPSDPEPPKTNLHPVRTNYTTVKGDTWATVSKKNYASTGYAGALAKDPRNAAIYRSVPSLTGVLPTGTIVVVPAFK